MVDAVRVSTDVGYLWLPTSDQVILTYMQSAGTWEEAEGQLLRSLLKPTSRFLDVGANVGYFSALAAKCSPAGTIDAVEPEPRSLALLRFNLWALAPHAKIWPLALGHSRGVAALQVEANNPGNTRVNVDHTLATQLAVTARGDELFDGRTFDVIKIDVQGFETDVISGLQGVLKRSENACMVVEFFPEAIVDRGQQPLDALRLYRSMGLDRVVNLEGKLLRLSEEEILSVCSRSGRAGYVNLVLRKQRTE